MHLQAPAYLTREVTEISESSPYVIVNTMHRWEHQAVLLGGGKGSIAGEWKHDASLQDLMATYFV